MAANRGRSSAAALVQQNQLEAAAAFCETTNTLHLK